MQSLYSNLPIDIQSTEDKKNIKINYGLLIFIVLFVFNDSSRMIFGTKAGWMNIPFLIVGLIFFTQNIFRKNRIHYDLLILVSLFSVLILSTSLFNRENNTYNEMTFCNLLIPLFIMCIKISGDEALKTLRLFLKFYNLLILSILSFGLIDYLTHSSIQLFLAKTIFKGSDLGDLIYTEHNYGIYRYYSFVGHPLQTAKYFLTFFILNSIYARYVKHLINPHIVSLITLLGLILCASKTALILGLVLIIFFSGVKKHKWLYFTVLIGGLIIFINTPLFKDNLEQRFIDGYSSGDITSGRNTLFDVLLNSTAEKPHFFIGGGSGYSRNVAATLNGDINNFEYPFIMFAYDYGIVGTVLLYIFTFIYPLIIFLYRKRMFIFFSFLILTIMVNTNNGLSSLGSDSLSQLCFIILLLINLSKKDLKETHFVRKKKFKIVW